MQREYVVLDNGVIYYDEDGRRISFLPDPANPDYQAYLNKDKAEQSTPMVTDETATL